MNILSAEICTPIRPRLRNERQAGFSREAVSEILQGKMVRIPVLKTMNDMRLMYLSWVFRYLLSRHLILHRWERLLDEAASQSTRRSGNIQSEEFRRRIPCQKKADLHLIQEFFISCNLMNSLFSPPQP